MEYLGNIFFDFDDTQYITTPSHRRYIDERWGIKTMDSDYIGNPPLQNVINKHLPAHADKVSFNEVYLDVGLNFHTSAEWHKDAMPFKDMREVIMALAKEFTLWTVTLRQKTGMELVKYMNEIHTPKCMKGVHCGWEFIDGEYVHFPKLDFMMSVPGKKIAFFDDSPREIIKAQDNIPSYLFDPTGRYANMNEIKNRVESWREIGDLLIGQSHKYI